MPATCTNGPRASAANVAGIQNQRRRCGRQPAQTHATAITARTTSGRAAVSSANPSTRCDSIHAFPWLPNHGELGLGMTKASRSTPGGLLRQ